MCLIYWQWVVTRPYRAHMIAQAEESAKVACVFAKKDGIQLIAQKGLAQEIALGTVLVMMAYVNVQTNGLDHTVVYPSLPNVKRLAWQNAKRELPKATREQIVVNLACEIALKRIVANRFAFKDCPLWKQSTIGFMHSNK